MTSLLRLSSNVPDSAVWEAQFSSPQSVIERRLLTLPEGQREEYVACCATFAAACTVHDLAECGRPTFMLLSTISRRLRSPLTSSLTSLIDACQPCMLKEIVDQFERTSLDRGETLAECLVLLHEEKQPPRLWQKLLSCLLDLREEADRREMTRAVKAIGDLEGYYAEDALNALVQVPLVERLDFSKGAHDLFVSLQYRGYFRLYLQKLMECSYDERKPFILHLLTIDSHIAKGWIGIRGDRIVEGIIGAIAVTDPLDRAELIGLALDFLKQIGCENAIGQYEATERIFLSLTRLPQPARVSFCEDAWSIIGCFQKRMECEGVLQGLCTASRLERQDLMGRTLSIVDKNNVSDCGEVLCALSLVKLTERDECIHLAQTLAQKMLPKRRSSRMGAILRALQKVTSTERKAVCRSVVPLLRSDLREVDDIEEAITVVAAIRKDKRESCVSWMQKCVWGQWKTLQAFGTLEKGEWPLFFKQLSDISQGKPVDLDPIARALVALSENKRHEVVSLGALLFRTILVQEKQNAGSQLACALTALGRVSINELPTLVDQTLRLAKNCGSKSGWIVEKLSSVDEKQREALIMAVALLISDVDDGENIAGLIEIMCEVRPDDRQSLAQQVSELGQRGNKEWLLRSLKACHRSVRESICILVKGITADHGLVNNRSLADVIDRIRQIKRDDRPKVLKEALQFLKDTMSGREIRQKPMITVLAGDILGCPIPHLIWSNLPLIAPESRRLYFKAIVRAANLDFFRVVQLDEEGQFRRILGYAFASRILRKTSHMHLLGLLQSQELSPAVKWRVCQMMRLYHEELQLHESQPLLLALINQIAACDPHALQQINNPYCLYHTIREQLAIEKEQIIDAFVDNEAIGGRSARWARLQPSWRMPPEYTVSDLPEGVNSRTLRTLFDRLFHRLQRLLQEERRAILDEIRKSHLLDLPNLRRNLLRDGYVTGLLELPISPFSPILPAQLYLFRSLKAIEDAFSIFNLRDKLSVGEAMLLKFSASIQMCRVGRDEGLANYYNLLPREYRLPSDRQAMGETSPTRRRAELLIRENVQKVLFEGLKNEKFLQDVTGTSTVVQPPHVTLYLANRIGEQIGLSHRLEFDPHTEFLNETLLEKKVEELLTCFFAHCPLRLVVQQLINESTPLLEGKTFLGTVELLEMVSTGDSLAKCFNCNAAEIPQSLTPIGALRLLVAISYAELC